MIEHIWSILCRKSVIDPESNNVSLTDVLEQLTATIHDIKPLKDKPKGQPIIIPVETELVTLWQQDEERANEITTMFEFRDSEDRLLLSSVPHTASFNTAGRRFRMRNTIKGLPLTKNGIYHFEIKLMNEKTGKFETRAKVPLEVKLKAGTPKNPSTKG